MGIISTLKCRIINYIKSKSELLQENEVFNKGELIIETNENNDTYKYVNFKLGDGIKKYSELPYFYKRQQRFRGDVFEDYNVNNASEYACNIKGTPYEGYSTYIIKIEGQVEDYSRPMLFDITPIFTESRDAKSMSIYLTPDTFDTFGAFQLEVTKFGNFAKYSLSNNSGAAGTGSVYHQEIIPLMSEEDDSDYGNGWKNEFMGFEIVCHQNFVINTVRLDARDYGIF